MNVNMDEFIVAARASHILFTLTRNAHNFKSIHNLGTTKTLSKLKSMIPISNIEAFWDTDSRLNIIKNLRFILEGAIPGMVISSFVLARVDHTLENGFMLTFPHKRSDNGEVVDVKLFVVITETDILLIAPFNCPGIGENHPNQYVVSILDTHLLDIPHNNKVAILDILDKNTDSEGNTYGHNLLKVIDTMATDIHMQCEYFLKAHSHVQDSEYRVITKDSKEFEHIYKKYADSIDYAVDDDIAITDFMPIIVSEDEVNKTLCCEHKYNGLVGRIESRIIGCESYEDLNLSTSNSTREALIRCPEENVPKAIKLPYNVIYIGYNNIIKENEPNCFHALLSCEEPILDDAYIPGAISLPGVEGFDPSVAKELFISLKQFGISKTSKFAELCYPILKMPKDLAKSAIITIKSVYSASAKIEREESDRIKEKMLNDELDVTMDKVDNIFKKYMMLTALSFMLGGFFMGLIIWFILKGRVTKSKIKSYERVERRLVSVIREYETKISFANQESDYKSVKNLTRTMDTYKMMLDKLREVKKESLGKEEKYTDTYKEYQD